ncbi:ATP-binding protein [Tepidimicrobium xylanilyticum]
MEFLRKSIEQNEKETKEMLLKERQEKIASLTRSSNIPKRYRNATFENFNPKDNPRALERAKGFVEAFPGDKGLLLTGPVGTGKTHLAAAIANSLLNKLYSVYFGNVVDIMGFIKSTYNQDSEISERDAISIMTDKVDLFIIDDLGKENNTEYTLSMLYQLINRVYENEKPIVITTNFNSIELSRKLGERGQAIVSRVTEMCEPVIFKGEDWRLKR